VTTPGAGLRRLALLTAPTNSPPISGEVIFISGEVIFISGEVIFISGEVFLYSVPEKLM
jgi:hypothetical protein